MTLSKDELIRYSRQLALPEVGRAGQERLRAAKVAVIGAGGLGSPLLEYLAGAGVGELGIFDCGPVELSNLHRQPLYTTADIGAPKSETARRRLLEINPDIKVNAAEGWLDSAQMPAALAPYDYVADCTDNFRTRAAINRACLELDKPFVHAAVYQLEGQLAVFNPRRGPCLECLWPGLSSAPDQSCTEAGVLGPVAGAMACLQATELLKLILGIKTLENRFIMLDLRGWTVTSVEMKKLDNCPVCGPHAAREKAFIAAVEPECVTPQELKSAMVSGTPPKLIDLRHEWERGICCIDGDEWADFNAVMENGGGLPRPARLVLYCKEQSKSTAAYKRLRELGFSDVKVLRGGMDAWTGFSGGGRQY